MELFSSGILLSVGCYKALHIFFPNVTLFVLDHFWVYKRGTDLYKKKNNLNKMIFPNNLHLLPLRPYVFACMVQQVLCCISANEHAERAFNLGLAAVLGEGVYNFGELVGTQGHAFFTTNQMDCFIVINTDDCFKTYTLKPYHIDMLSIKLINLGLYAHIFI